MRSGSSRRGIDPSAVWIDPPGDPQEDRDASGPSGKPPRAARQDAFTPARRRTFLKHLAKTGCLTDAARLTGVAARTVYRHQEADADFARHVDLAIEMAGGGIEQIAWERAVLGVPEQFACGGKVHTRQRYSDALLRLLLQGTNPKKYGPRPGFTRKRLRKWERQEIEREIRQEIASQEPCIEDVRDEILRRVAAMERQQHAASLAAGWTRTDEGDWIPPGWVRDPAWAPEQRDGNRAGADDTPRDSV